MCPTQSSPSNTAKLSRLSAFDVPTRVSIGNAYKAVFWPIGDAAWPARAFRNAHRLRLLRYYADYLRHSCSDNFLEGTSLTTFPHRIITKYLRKLLEEAVLKSSVAKRSVVIGGHKTSVSLEDPFWNDLKEIAYRQKATLSQVVEQIDRAREHSNLSSAIRLFVLDQARTGIVGSTLISRSPKLRTG